MSPEIICEINSLCEVCSATSNKVARKILQLLNKERQTSQKIIYAHVRDINKQT